MAPVPNNGPMAGPSSQDGSYRPAQITLSLQSENALMLNESRRELCQSEVLRLSTNQNVTYAFFGDLMVQAIRRDGFSHWSGFTFVSCILSRTIMDGIQEEFVRCCTSDGILESCGLDH